MLSINMSDVMNVINSIKSYLIAIGVIIGVAARGKKKKQVQQTAYAVPAPEAQAAPAPAEAPEESQKRVCAACGADLAEGEDACPYCGTKAE